jgi:osmotically-inducible protein OsmY
MSLVPLSHIAISPPNRPATPQQQSNSELLDAEIAKDDVQSRAQASLRACPHREVQKTTCLFNKGVMLLQGDVSSFHLKQIAQTILMNVEGVRHIVNTIQVHAADQATKANQA